MPMKGRCSNLSAISFPESITICHHKDASIVCQVMLLQTANFDQQGGDRVRQTVEQTANVIGLGGAFVVVGARAGRIDLR